MRYRISQIKLAPGEPKERIPDRIRKKLNMRQLAVNDWRIVKESLDARDKSRIRWVYTVDFDTDRRLPLEQPKTEKYVLPGPAPMAERPAVVGFGPAGMFAALILAQAGARPIVLERGEDADSRAAMVERFWKEGVLDEESNVQFGEGGAGAFSDGKLTTGIKDVRIRKVLEELVRFGAPEEILYKQRPHVGTDLLRGVVKNLRREVTALGGEVMFGCRVTDLTFRDGALEGLVYRDPQGEERSLPCSAAVLAPGHSARDTFVMLAEREIAMERKPFSIGVRIEHPQSLIDKAQYGAPAGELGLPPAEYKLSARCSGEKTAGRGVYTFCMCPGGHVIPASSEKGMTVTNGMSFHARNSGKANSALLCDVRVTDFDSDDVLAGVRFQQRYERLAFAASAAPGTGEGLAADAGKTTDAAPGTGEGLAADAAPGADEGLAASAAPGTGEGLAASGGRYRPPEATWGAFRDGRAPRVESCLPEFAAAAFREAMPELGRKLKGFDSDEAVIYAVETRSSSPVRILRGGDGQSVSLKGLYPCGEGAGYAGGIVSAAVDGIKTAEKLIENAAK